MPSGDRADASLLWVYRLHKLLECRGGAKTGTGDVVMELHEIRYFLALSKTLNFTKAAETCNVSQPRDANSEDGGRTRRTVVLAGARQHAPDRTRTTAGAASRGSSGADHRGEGNRLAFSASRQRAASAGRHVHHRASAVRQLSQPLPGGAFRRRNHDDRGDRGAHLRICC